VTSAWLRAAARLIGAALIALLTFVALVLVAAAIGGGSALRFALVGVVGISGLALGVTAAMYVLLGREVFTKEVPGDRPPPFRTPF
jgi:hypothetical protein